MGMTIEVKKQDRENSQSLVRRFSRRIQQSGVLRKAREGRFHKRSESKKMRKRTALRREELRAEYEKLKKLGLSKK